MFNVYSIVTPLFEASDELWHYPFVQHLLAGGGLPVQHAGQTDAEAPWRQEGSQPPLFYVAAALISAPFDHSNWRDLRRINPHADMGVPTRDGNSNAILHTPAERWPWTGAALAVHAARLASVLMSTATTVFAYLIARALFTRRDEGRAASAPHRLPSLLRLSVIVFTAFVPMFAFIGSVLNNDNAAVLFSTLGLWWALRVMQRQDLSIRSALIAGVIAGLGALSKTSALGLIGLFGLAALLAGFRGSAAQIRFGRRMTGRVVRVMRWVAVMGASVAVIAGWWYVRNITLYGDLLGWNAFLDVVGRRDVPATLAQLWSEREGFVWAYWGVFGTLNLIMPVWMYVALNLTVVAAALGWVWQLMCVLRRRCQPTADAWRAVVLCGIWALVLFVSFLRWTSLTPASQGRLLFPCIAVIAAFTAYGLWRIHRLVLVAASVLLMGIAIAVPFAVIAPAYAQPANMWSQRLREPINAAFADGALDLVEGQSDTATLAPGDEVTLRLNWRLNAPLPRNYSVFVHLVDENEVIVAQRDMYPGQGNMATSEQPAGYQWSDHYTLRVSPLELGPKPLHWRVGLYDAQTGARLTLRNGEDFVEFGALSLSGRSTTPAGPPLLRYSNGAALAGYAVEPRTLSAGQPLTVTLNWAQMPTQSDYAFSLQVLDEAANKIGSHDGPFVAGQAAYPIAINADAPPGVYRLLLVVYRTGDFGRVGAYDGRDQFAGDQIPLTRLRLN